MTSKELTLFFAWALFDACRKHLQARARSLRWDARHRAEKKQRRANRSPEERATERLQKTQWRRDNPDRFRASQQRFRRKNPIAGLLRNRIFCCIDRGYKSAVTLELLGCSVEQLKLHLERQFKPGMTWENRGKGGWEIDHIKPCASFDLRDSAQQKICFHHTNLQPLWAVENLSKGAKCGC